MAAASRNLSARSCILAVGRTIAQSVPELAHTGFFEVEKVGLRVFSLRS
jgi:hypothetical protein